jgi:hypothetical protein
MGDSREALAELVHEPRLADACLAEHDDVLPRTLPGLLPAIDEYPEFGLAADEWGQPSRRNAESAAHAGRRTTR